MTLSTFLQTMLRWRVFILAITLGLFALISLRLFVQDNAFEARVKLQFSAPQDESVVLYDRSRPGTSQDELIVARNNFIEVLKSLETRRRLIEKLQLNDTDAAFKMDVETLRDTDFVYFIARARTAKLSEQIANAFVAEALGYFGEIRAKPATAAKNILAEEIRNSTQELHEVEKAFNDFRTKNGIATLDQALRNYQELIQQLQIERDKRLADRLSQRSVAQIDTTIAQYQAQLERLIELEPTYINLQQTVNQARERRELLLQTYAEADLKEHTIKAVSYIQVVEPATLPQKAVPTNNLVLMLLGLIGSIGVGVMVALLLDYMARQQIINLPRKVQLAAETHD